MAYRRRSYRSTRSSYGGRPTRRRTTRAYATTRRRSRRSYGGSARTVRIVIEQPSASPGRLDQLGIGVKAARPPRKAMF